MTDKEKQLILETIITTYLLFDQEDYCYEKCGTCSGCRHYQELKKAYKIAKKEMKALTIK